jgi:hypothetical protein
VGGLAAFECGSSGEAAKRSGKPDAKGRQAPKPAIRFSRLRRDSLLRFRFFPYSSRTS